MRILCSGLLMFGGLMLVVARQPCVEDVTTIADLAPRGWRLLKAAEGDLNGDGRLDAVAVFSKSTPDTAQVNESEETLGAPRLLLLAMRDERNLLRAVAASDNVMLCRSCGVILDEPLSNLSIAEGAVLIEQNIVSDCAVTFAHRVQLSKGQWRIDGEIRVRERRTGRQRAIKPNRPIPLADFNVSNFNACGAEE